MIMKREEIVMNGEPLCTIYPLFRYPADAGTARVRRMARRSRNSEASSIARLNCAMQREKICFEELGWTTSV